ncbi:hypothetical protein FSP39_021233 [Pinctada imbricata]|uniref:CUB domain-containing protein n=1 Tax=Pinctada imbricata TaxID=66713 RepID=A0AA88YVD4_PINIB|nr:hypothetical protein FSP39_021233 [Pinctada imbricata]
MGIFTVIMVITVPEKRHTCGRTFVDVSGTITSPNYPSSYPPGLDCKWVIQAPMGVEIDMELSAFEIWALPGYPCSDFLQISGGVLTPYRRCGLNFFTEILTSKSNEVNVTFHTDSSGQGSGFKLSWRLDSYQMFLYQKSLSERETPTITSTDKTTKWKTSTENISSMSSRGTLITKVTDFSKRHEGSKRKSSVPSMQSSTEINTLSKDNKKGKQYLDTSIIEHKWKETPNRLSILEISLIVLVILLVLFALVGLIYLKRKRVSEISVSAAVEDIDDKYKYHDPESLGLYRLSSRILNTGSDAVESSTHNSSCSDASYLEPVTSLWPIACHDKSMKYITNDEETIYNN